MLKTVHIFVETDRLVDEQKAQKNSVYLKCNIINVFTGTFDQFNASLINKSINLLIPRPEKFHFLFAL